MKSFYVISTLAALASTTIAQDNTASDGDVALVRQQIQDVVTAASSLDQSILAYSGTADTSGLQAASDNVVSVLNAGTAAVNPIQGVISVNQGVTLLDPVNTLNTVVNMTVTDAISRKALLVSFCIGPTIFESLQEQFTASNVFSQAIANKVDPSIRDFALSLAQPSLDSLNQALRAFSDQTTLPASCRPTSTASATSSVVVSTSTPSVVVASTTTIAPAATSIGDISSSVVVSASFVGVASSVASTSTQSSTATTSALPSSSNITIRPAVTFGRSLSGSICTAPVTRPAALQTYTTAVTYPDGQVATTTITLCKSACKNHPYVTTSTCSNGSVTTYTVTPSRYYGTGSLAPSTRAGYSSVSATVPVYPPSYTGGAMAFAADCNVLIPLGAAAMLVF